MSIKKQKQDIEKVLKRAVSTTKGNTQGKVPSYIPELANVNADLCMVGARLHSGEVYFAGKGALDTQFTLQSVAKLIPLIGLIEEFGSERVFSWVRLEPSGTNFSSVARLDHFGPKPSNPMLNSGAILLCSHIPGEFEDQIKWLDKWMQQLFGSSLRVNTQVFASERRTGDRNRALAYLMKSSRVLKGDVEKVLEIYFYLCSYEVNIDQATFLPTLLASGGKDAAGQQIISTKTARQVLAIMSTCGLYNASGTHLVNTGMPAKSGVSGLIVACAPQVGIAVMSPRVDEKGNSVRGERILEYLANELNWHWL